MPFDLNKERDKITRKAMQEAKKTGARMAILRQLKGIKQSWVAKKMRIHPSHLCGLEQGKRYWREHHIKAFLEAIGETTTNNKGKHNAK